MLIVYVTLHSGGITNIIIIIGLMPYDNMNNLAAFTYNEYLC